MADAVDLKMDDFDLESMRLSDIEYYYLLRRYGAILTVWNSLDMQEPKTDLKTLVLSELNKHFKAYDLGCCLQVAPCDLYDLARTDGDAVQAAEILTNFAVNDRGWKTVELTGLDFMVDNAITTCLAQNITPLRCDIDNKIRELANKKRDKLQRLAKQRKTLRQDGI